MFGYAHSKILLTWHEPHCRTAHWLVQRTLKIWAASIFLLVGVVDFCINFWVVDKFKINVFCDSNGMSPARAQSVWLLNTSDRFCRYTSGHTNCHPRPRPKSRSVRASCRLRLAPRCEYLLCSATVSSSSVHIATPHSP